MSELKTNRTTTNRISITRFQHLRARKWQWNRGFLRGRTCHTTTFICRSNFSISFNLRHLLQRNGGNTVAAKRVDFAYNLVDQFTSVTRYANTAGTTLVATSTYGYDNLNRLTSLDHKRNTTTLAGYDFEYDAASRITEIDSYLDGVTAFTYDVTNQLTAADHTGQTDESYSFDLNGNRDMSGYTVGDNNQITTDGTYNYTYDDEGNRLTKTKISNGDKEEYTWDHRNRLVTITFKNSGGTVTKTVDQTYDLFDRWIGRVVDPDGATGSATVQNTYFAYDRNQILFQFDGAAASDLTNRYLWGPNVDQILADEAVTSLGSAGTVTWPLTDHLGTPRDLAQFNSGTSTTSVVNHRRYDSYGQPISETNSAVDHIFSLTGRALDEATGLRYHSTRWTDPASGEWLGEDLLGILAGDPNFGRYVLNDPVSLTDPTGMEPPIFDGGPFRRMSVVPNASPPIMRPQPEIGRPSRDTSILEQKRDFLRQVAQENPWHFPVMKEDRFVIDKLSPEQVSAAYNTLSLKYGIQKGDQTVAAMDAILMLGAGAAAYRERCNASPIYVPGLIPAPLPLRRTGPPIPVAPTGDAIIIWIGKDGKPFYNENGDLILQSRNGLREVQFHFNKTFPHKQPHIHLIQYKFVKNQKEKVFDERLFPCDASPW
jgi:RHS repeat-associated protein